MVEALPTYILVNEELNLWLQPSQDPVYLNFHTNSVFLHSRKRPAPVTDTIIMS